MRSIFLDAEHQQELVEAYKTTTDKRLRERIQAVLMTAQGHSQPEIAAALCLCTRTVRRYLRAYQKEGLGGLPIRWGPGRPTRIPESLADTVRQWILDGPLACGRLRANWTYAELADQLHKESGIQVSRRAVCDFCHRHGIRPYRPTYRLLRGDPDKQRAAQEELEALKKRPQATSSCCLAKTRRASRSCRRSSGRSGARAIGPSSAAGTTRI